MYEMAPLPLLDELERLARKPRGAAPYAIVRDVYGNTTYVYCAWPTELSPAPEDENQETYGFVIEVENGDYIIITEPEIVEVLPADAEAT